jgi:DNA repair protein RadC
MTIARRRHIAAPYRSPITHGGSMSIKDWPVNERPRAKLLANGAHSLSDAALRAVLLGGSARRGQDVVARARELVKPARARHAAAVMAAHNHPLGSVMSIHTGSDVTRLETRAGLGAGQDQ